jgi:hypothetical protein
MRRSLLLAYAVCSALSLAPGSIAFAQAGSTHGSTQQSQQEEADQKKKDAEWNTGANLDLPGKKNAGPCPYVKVLYDAGRYIEFKDAKVSANAVSYSGEIQTLASGCSYQGVQPIHVETEILFAFGRGPQAKSASHVYRYWVAVTDRNLGVINKEYFDVEAKFPDGKDRVLVVDRINGINIPRANSGVSGANFEILVGFDVTPEMADFNRDGKRFRLNAVPTVPAVAEAR